MQFITNDQAANYVNQAYAKLSGFQVTLVGFVKASVLSEEFETRDTLKLALVALTLSMVCAMLAFIDLGKFAYQLGVAASASPQNAEVQAKLSIVRAQVIAWYEDLYTAVDVEEVEVEEVDVEAEKVDAEKVESLIEM